MTKNRTDAHGAGRRDRRARNDERPTFVAIHSRGMIAVIAHPSIRFTLEQDSMAPVKIVSRDAPPLADE